VCALAAYATPSDAGQQCKPSTVVSGVDLNPAGDGTLGWSTSGAGFAVIKATQGTSYEDSDFSENWAALKAAHVVRGAYHFFDATVSGVDQANYYLAFIGTLDAGDLPPILDIECPVSGESDCLGNGNSGDAPASQITQAMNDFLTTVKSATGLTPIVYSYGSWFSDNGVDTTGLQAYPLWLADYSGTSCFNVPDPWSAATFWQYDASGSVSGVNVDDDYFLGSMSQLTTFTANGSNPIAIDAGSGGEDAGVTPCTVSTDNQMGVCIDTATCASMGGMSTADFCPGPDNIQCCTGLPDAGLMMTMGSGSGTSSGGGSKDAGTSGGKLDASTRAGGQDSGSSHGSGTGAVPPGDHEGLVGDEVDPGSGGGCAVARGTAAKEELLGVAIMSSLVVAVRGRRRRAR